MKANYLRRSKNKYPKLKEHINRKIANDKALRKQWEITNKRFDDLVWEKLNLS